MIFYCKVILTKTTESYFFFLHLSFFIFFFSVQKAVRAKVMPSQKSLAHLVRTNKITWFITFKRNCSKAFRTQSTEMQTTKKQTNRKNKAGRIFFTEVLVRVIWCSESPSTGTQEENQQNTRNKLNPSDPEIKTDSELEHWLFRLVWLFHTHPSAFWAWTVICTRSDYVNMSMHWTMRPSEHLHACSNACFSVLGAYRVYVGGRRRM